MMADPELDAISLAVPPHVQPDAALGALASKKHVFCEKPLATTVEAAARLLTAARQAAVAHMIDFELPAIEEWQVAKRILDAGGLGSLRNVSITWEVPSYTDLTRLNPWKRDPAAGGGALNTHASHILHYIEWLFGPIRRLWARLWRDEAQNSNVPDQMVNLSMELASEVCVSVSLNARAASLRKHRLEICGEKATLILENSSRDYASGFQLSLGPAGSTRFNPIPVVLQEKREGDGRVLVVGRLVRQFVNWIMQGTPGTPSLEEGYRVQCLLAAARQAHVQGNWVEV